MATYSEASNIDPWIEGVTTAVPDADILIIDDLSPDHTATVITEFAHTFPQVGLHSRAGKQGLNSAHIYAMQYALDNGYGALVTMGADGSHQPAQIPAVLGALSGGLATSNFCIGTRTHGGSHQAALPRRILSHGANITARVLLPMGSVSTRHHFAPLTLLPCEQSWPTTFPLQVTPFLLNASRSCTELVSS